MRTTLERALPHLADLARQAQRAHRAHRARAGQEPPSQPPSRPRSHWDLLSGLPGAFALDLESFACARVPTLRHARRVRRALALQPDRGSTWALWWTWLGDARRGLVSVLQKRAPKSTRRWRKLPWIGARTRRRERRRVEASGLFDAAFYTRTYPDVARSGLDPLEHYLSLGFWEKRWPNPLFDGAFYAAQRPHLERAGIPALVHYLRSGAREELDPTALFSTSFYLDMHPAAALHPISPLSHYRDGGFRSPTSPHPLFDAQHYREQVPEVVEDDALAHFLWQGVFTGCQPNAFFDLDHYRGANPDVAATGVNPLEHYVRFGSRERREVSERFDGVFYLAAYPEVARAGLDPLSHFLLHGQREGRLPYRRQPAPWELHDRPAWRLKLHFGRPKVLLVAPDGRDTALNRTLLALAEHFDRRLGLECIVVLDEDGPLHPAFEAYAAVLVQRFAGLEILVAGSALARFEHADLCLAVVAGVRNHAYLETIHGWSVPLAGLLEGDLAGVSEPLANAWRTRAHPLVFSEPETGFFTSREERQRFDLEQLVRTLTSELPARADRSPPSAQRTMQNSAARRRPKVVFTTPFWNISGVNTFTETLMKGLIERGFDCELVFTSSEHPVPIKPDVPSRTLDEVVPGRDGEWSAGRWKRVSQLLVRSAPCIFVPGYDYFASAVSPGLPDDVGILGIVHSDDYEHYEHAARLGRYWNALVGVSETCYERLLSLNRGMKPFTHYIPYGIDLPEVPGRARARGSKPLRIVYTGRIEQTQKNVLALPTLVRELDAQGFEYQLTLVGEGSQLEVLRRELAPQVVAGRVCLPGRMNQAQVRAELASSDVFLLVSHFEGLPVSMLEAMSYGCVPVVSDMDSGVPELVEQGVTGFSLPVHDLAAFAAKMRFLADHPDVLESMAQAASAKIVRRYGSEQMTDAYAEVLEEIWRSITQGLYRRPAPIMPASDAGAIQIPTWLERDPASFR